VSEPENVGDLARGYELTRRNWREAYGFARTVINSMPGSYSPSGSLVRNVRMVHVFLLFAVILFGIPFLAALVLAGGSATSFLGELPWLVGVYGLVLVFVEFCSPLWYVTKRPTRRAYTLVMFDPGVAMVGARVPLLADASGTRTLHASNLISSKRGSGSSSEMVVELLRRIGAAGDLRILATAQNEEVRDKYYVRKLGFHVLDGRKMVYPPPHVIVQPDLDAGAPKQ
jgi:hypothetical protein